ncbi:MAG: hypothetical protein EOP84_32450 [Verrucomicrobiaceae bacterium]|nr:MAG: hypothetical protein EOP84_32450 [Verrucomicrobiaceae bacterium]
MYIDRIDLTFVAEDLTQLDTDFTSIEQFLNTLPVVSDAERKYMSKLGMKNEGLALRIIEAGRLHQNVISRGIDFTKIDRDLTARAQLLGPLNRAQYAVTRLQDARLLLGVDLYAAALSIYNSLRRNAQTASLRAIVDELSQGFARPRRTTPEPAPGNGSGIIVP